MPRDYVGLERRRLAASRLLLKNVPQAEVARQLGVSRQSVSRWAVALDQKGAQGLKRAPRPGRKPRLTETQRERLRRLLRNDPSPWTLVRVRDLIEKQFGVTYNRDSLTRFLHEAGMVPRPGHGWAKTPG